MRTRALQIAVCLILSSGLALAPWFGLVLAVCFALGFTDSMQATTRNGVIQLVTPDQLRGRVSSFQQLMTLGMPSIGLGLMGVGAAAVGAPIALAAGAATCALINLGILGGRKELRQRELGSAPAPAHVSSGTRTPTTIR